jgi:hypothetical protein
MLNIIYSITFPFDNPFGAAKKLFSFSKIGRPVRKKNENSHYQLTKKAQLM